MKGDELMAVTWPDSSPTDHDSLACVCHPYVSYNINDNCDTSSINVEFDDRSYEDIAMCLGLQLDELLIESPMSGCQNMDSAMSPSSCVAPEHDDSRSFACDEEGVRSAAESLTWAEALEMDMNLIADISSSFFQGRSEDQAYSVGRSSAAGMTMINVMSSHDDVPIIKLTSYGEAEVDWKKTMVRKSVLENAVERLGGGKDGALKLWKLIQMWVKHQKHPQEMTIKFGTSPISHAIADHRHGDLLFLSASSHADVRFQNRIYSTSSNSDRANVNLEMDNVSSLSEAYPRRMAGVKRPCHIASTKSYFRDQSSGSDGMTGFILPEFHDSSTSNKYSSAASASRAARKNKMSRQRRSSAHHHLHHHHHRQHFHQRSFSSPNPSVYGAVRGGYSHSSDCHPNLQNVQTISSTTNTTTPQTISNVNGMKVLQVDLSKGSQTSFSRKECSRSLNESSRKAGKFDEVSLRTLGDASNILDMENVNGLCSKQEDHFQVQTRSLKTSKAYEVSKDLVKTIATSILESSNDTQSQLDSLMEEIMSESGEELPVLGHFTHLDSTLITQYDDFLELHNATTSSLVCNSTCTNNRPAISDFSWVT